MYLFHDAAECYQKIGSSVVTIGNFDGVHLGHRFLIEKTVKKAVELSLPSVAITFDPHPGAFISSHPPKLLCSLEKKLEYLSSYGIHAALIIRFSRKLADMTMASFTRNFLCDRMRIASLFIGYDFHMGCDLAGFKEISTVVTFPVFQVNAVVKDGNPISSTGIRKLLEKGNVSLAENFLGHSFSVQGKIIHGAGRGGPLLGIPTINLEYSAKMALPAPGVYSTAVLFLDGNYSGKIFPSVTSFCNNPTFFTENLTLETHLLNFSDDVYGCSVEIFFLEYLRNAKKFDNFTLLKHQLELDIEQRRSLRRTPLLTGNYKINEL